MVGTDKGKVRGIHQDGLYEFKGIPFAAPPVGPLRWLAPQPIEPWNGVLDTLNFKSVGPQNVRQNGLLKLPGFEAAEIQNEDCLYLNIWTSGLDEALRPVMVWIHGGAFTSGSGSQPSYHGDILASRGNVVIVTINYRLGVLGFLNLKEATGGEIPSTGNEGLLDQLAALQWVRNNIRGFGGDPQNVTVFGESSGAMSIGCLLGMPKSRGLFHKAILESGTGNMARTLSSSVSISQKFLELAGIKGAHKDSLRSLPVERLLAIQQELTAVAPGGITPVAPVIDGTVLPDAPLAMVQAGSGLGVPIIVGNNLDENKISYPRQPDIKNMDQSTLYRLCGAILPNADVSRFINIYQNSRSKRGEPVEPHEIYSAIRADASFRIPAINLCQAYHKNGQLAYNYLFTWESPILGGFLGACHTLEIGFVFGRMNPDFCGSGPRVEQLSKTIQESWLAFARHGKPDCQSLGNWPPYGDARKTMILGARCYVAEAVNEEERLAWESVLESPVI